MSREAVEEPPPPRVAERPGPLAWREAAYYASFEGHREEVKRLALDISGTPTPR